MQTYEKVNKYSMPKRQDDVLEVVRSPEGNHISFGFRAFSPLRKLTLHIYDSLASIHNNSLHRNGNLKFYFVGLKLHIWIIFYTEK